MAADRGFASAQYNLGVSYEHGMGILRDDQQAVRLYRLAADQGHAVAQNSLALRYATGQGVPQDNIEAYKWCSLAAASGNSEAQEFRELLTAKMTPSQVEKAQEMVRASVRHVYTPGAPSR
jgi:TPR repeat protein